MTLEKYLERLSPDRWIYLGTMRTKDQGSTGGGGYVGIFQKKDIAQHGWDMFLGREIYRVYARRLVPPFGTCILVEGHEAGRFWTLVEQDEYFSTHDSITFNRKSYAVPSDVVLDMDEIMRMKADGMMDKEIAAKVGVPRSTIVTRVQRYRKKMGNNGERNECLNQIEGDNTDEQSNIGAG